jgi:hypothetical protein
MAKDKSKKGWRSCATVLLVLLLVLLLAAGGVVYVVDHYLDKINKINPDDEYVIPPEDEDFEADEGAPEGPSSSAPGSSDTPSAPGSSVPPSSTPTTSAPPAPPPAPPVTFDDSKLINILLVGQDKNEQTTIRQRSDSMILCSINTDTGEVSLISFQRDLYVAIPGGYSNNRLNAAYAFGGFKLLNKTLTHNFGVSIDGNIEVDFARFRQVIDAVGTHNLQNFFATTHQGDLCAKILCCLHRTQHRCCRCVVTAHCVKNDLHRVFPLSLKFPGPP